MACIVAAIGIWVAGLGSGPEAAHAGSERLPATSRILFPGGCAGEPWECWDPEHRTMRVGVRNWLIGPVVLVPDVPPLSDGDCLAVSPDTSFDVLGRPIYHACYVYADEDRTMICTGVKPAEGPGSCGTTYSLTGLVVP